MESLSTITTWEPPHRFVADSRDDMGPDDPTVATEWIVEARSGGACVVRVVHGWFTSGNDWDDQFEGHTYGWISFFRVLRLYLEHFRGQRGSPFQLMGVARSRSPSAGGADQPARAERRRGGQAGEYVTSRATSHRNRGMGGPARVARRLLLLNQLASSVSPSRSPRRDGWPGLSIDPFLLYGDQAPAASPAPNPCGRRG